MRSVLILTEASLFAASVRIFETNARQVDVWAFGCVIYECAMGKPPNADLREPQQLKSRMRRLNKPIELPENENFPEALRSLVSYTLTPDAKYRPSMRDVLEHKYLVNTGESHPTSILTELVNVYYTWLHGGGQRASLFIKGGAVASDAPGSLSTSDDEWNFSTTIDFEKRISTLLDIDVDIPEISDPSEFQSAEGEVTPKAVKDSAIEPQGRELTGAQKANFEARVRRGAELSNVFDLNKPDYEYKTKTDFRPVQERRVSDLPLRVMAEDRPPSIASNEIDLGDFDSSNYATVAPLTKLIDASTIRAKRDDLKLSRESSGTKAAPNINAPGAEDDYLAQQESNDRPATQDFSFPPKEWKQEREKGSATETTDTEHPDAKKSSVRKTMEWSFDTAMSETETREPELDPEPAIAGDGRAKKHATMQWSFPQAMAEASASSTQSVTAARPAPMLRTITMPVTSSEIDAAEDDIPRPSTAMSETVSEASLASCEADPFALDQDAHGYPAPGALDERGVSSYYHSEGDTLSPEHTVPYNSTVTGPAPYPTGPPARIGEEGFPGPSTAVAAATTVPQSGKKQKKKRRFTRSKKPQTLASDGETPAISSSPEPASPGTPGAHLRVTMPEIVPPAAEALDVNTSPEQLEKELGSMLGSFGSVLSAAGRVMGIRRRSRRDSRRRSSSEWESEE
jgi:serine/threonine protein kinase